MPIGGLRSVGQIYLYDNPLVKKPLSLAHVKPRQTSIPSRSEVSYIMAGLLGGSLSRRVVMRRD
jgi:phosphoketolase